MRHRARFIPEFSSPLEFPEVGAVAYLYEYRNGKPSAIAYSGKRTKPDWQYYFGDDAQRKEYIAKWIDGLNNRARVLAQRKAERENPTQLKVGDILHDSWGYDQTQCDYWQVVWVKPHTVGIRRISSDIVPGSQGDMCEMRTPAKDRFLIGSEVITTRSSGTRVSHHDGFRKWDGSPHYCSHYA